MTNIAYDRQPWDIDVSNAYGSAAGTCNYQQEQEYTRQLGVESNRDHVYSELWKISRLVHTAICEFAHIMLWDINLKLL